MFLQSPGVDGMEWDGMGWDGMPGNGGEGPAGHEESRQYLQGAGDLRAVWELGILLGVLPTLYRGKELAS